MDEVKAAAGAVITQLGRLSTSKLTMQIAGEETPSSAISRKMIVAWAGTWAAELQMKM